MGLSPWATPMKTWRMKTGREVERIDPAREKLFKRGRLFEPVIVEMGVDRLREQGFDVDVLHRNERYYDAEHGFISVEIDAEFVLAGEAEINGKRVVFNYETVNVDAKSVNGFASKKWGAEDTDEIPIEYASQFMTGLMVTRRRWCLVLALLGIDFVGLYWLERDDTTIAGMRKRLVSFWYDHVLADVPPDPIVYDDITALFPLDNGQAVEASDDVVAKVQKLAEVRGRMRTLKAQEDFLKFEVADFISPHARLTHKGQTIATWKGQPYTRFLQQEFEKDHPGLVPQYTNIDTVRVLRLPKEK